MDHSRHSPEKCHARSIVEEQAPEPTQGRVEPRRALGSLGEGLAADHMQRLGFEPLARNVRTRHGEIDLIVFDGHTLIFVEVKTRRARATPCGARPAQQPLEWLSTRQRMRLRRLASAWLCEEQASRPRAQEIRFDAVGVVVDEGNHLLRLDHVENAW
jgi:putative endonuclease